MRGPACGRHVAGCRGLMNQETRASSRTCRQPHEESQLIQVLAESVGSVVLVTVSDWWRRNCVDERKWVRDLPANGVLIS